MEFNAPKRTQTGVSGKSKYAGPEAGEKFDATSGSGQLKSVEADLGVNGFDRDSYVAAAEEALSTGVDASVRREQAGALQSAQSGNMGRSGGARALAQEARLMGDRTFALGKSDIVTDATKIGLSEDARRTGAALDTGRFEAEFDESQRRFGDDVNRFTETSDANREAAAENVRQFDVQADYGAALDDYYMNEFAPEQRKHETKAAYIGAAGDVVSGIGAAIGACWIAEACYGVDSLETHYARYAAISILPRNKVGKFLLDLYIKYGERTAEHVKKSAVLKFGFTKLFNNLVRAGRNEITSASEVK